MKVTVFLFHCSRCFYFWHANLISLLFEPDGKTNVLHSMSINWCITLVVSHGFHCFCSCFASIITFSSEKPPQQMLNALAKPTTKSDIYFVISIEYFYAPVNHKLIMSMLHQSHFIKAKAIFHEYFLVEFILFLYDFPLLAFYKFVQRIQYDTKEWRERKKKEWIHDKFYLNRLLKSQKMCSSRMKSESIDWRESWILDVYPFIRMCCCQWNKWSPIEFSVVSKRWFQFNPIKWIEFVRISQKLIYSFICY